MHAQHDLQECLPEVSPVVVLGTDARLNEASYLGRTCPGEGLTGRTADEKLDFEFSQ